jgi:hypothetical protein
MITFILSTILSINVAAQAPKTAPKAPVTECETYAANLDGVRVTICNGSVVSRCDAAGNCLFSAETY